jgi:GR25 family glycosyltransferase involved in LPS biosynthesis
MSTASREHEVAVTPGAGAALAEYFPRIFVVNLPQRTDRRRETVAELARVGLAPRPGAIEFFDAIRPESAGAFPSVGARGCFESHHALIKEARLLDLPRVLIMEDDVEFAPRIGEVLGSAVAQLARLRWDFAYLGHTVDVRSPDAGSHWVRFRRGFDTTHHPDGGPMHVDGAYADFRAYHPDTMTYLAAPSLVRQRSTGSDIHPSRVDTGWIPQPVVTGLRRIHREVSSRAGRGPWRRARR